jgi:hypothetical protein
MALASSPPRRYTTSRQLIAGDDFNNLNDHSFSFQTLTAVGASQVAAAPVNAANVEIPAGNAAAGVRLPPAYPGNEISILNNSSNTQNVYPALGEQIQNGATGYATANTAVTVLTNVNAVYFCIKKGFWQITKTTGP